MECQLEFQEFQARIPEKAAIPRRRFSVFGCLRTLVISAVLVSVTWFALHQLFGTTDPEAMWTELKRMVRVIF